MRKLPKEERVGPLAFVPFSMLMPITYAMLTPLALFTLLSGGLAFLAPQIPGIAAGFAIIWALAWRRQDAAVAAIEERDGATFHVRRTSPVRPMELVRTPGFKTARPERFDGAVS